jgi:hypothetical protein
MIVPSHRNDSIMTPQLSYGNDQRLQSTLESSNIVWNWCRMHFAFSVSGQSTCIWCLLRWICSGNCVLPFSVAASSAVPVTRCVVRTHNAWCETGHHIPIVSWCSVISQETANRSAMQFWNIIATSAMLSKAIEYMIKAINPATTNATCCP